MVTFFSIIIIVGIAMLFGSMIFGHDHDGMVLDHDGDPDHDGGSISIFSFKVIGSFLIGFGASAIFAVYQLEVNNGIACLYGFLFGVILAGISWKLLMMINKIQANSLVSSDSLEGIVAKVTLDINRIEAGEVSFVFNGNYMTRVARSVKGIFIQKGQLVTIVKSVGSDVFVELKETQYDDSSISSCIV